jgi:hypothetical protein
MSLLRLLAALLLVLLVLVLLVVVVLRPASEAKRLRLIETLSLAVEGASPLLPDPPPPSTLASFDAADELSFGQYSTFSDCFAKARSMTFQRWEDGNKTEAHMCE